MQPEQKQYAEILLTPEALGDRWTVAPHTLSQWRWKGNGPRFIKIGKKILYPLEGILMFENERVRSSTSQASVSDCLKITEQQ